MENVTLPVYDIVRSTSRFRASRVLQKTQWLPPKSLQQIQNQNLRMIIKHAYDTVPYYRRIFRQSGVQPGDIKSVEDLVKIPVLTKEAIQENSKDLVSRGFPVESLVRYRSGGSGSQIRFFVTKEQQSWEIAAEYRAYGWAGYKLGNKCFMFWASPIDFSRH